MCGESFYPILQQDYGSTYQVLRHSWHSSEEALITWEVNSNLLHDFNQMPLHPVIIDGAFQAAGAFLRDPGAIFVPFSLSELTLLRTLTPKGWLHLKMGKGKSRFDIDIYDCYSQLAVEIHDYRLRKIFY